MKVQKGSIFKPETNYYKIAGIILVIAFIQFFIAVTIAETQFPGYSTAENTLSDLAGTIVPVEPAATIFNVSITLIGILALSAVFLILKSGGCRLFSTCLTLMAVGTIGVGIFPGYTGEIHVLFAMMTFIFGSFAALFSYRLGLNIPMVVISMLVGLNGLLIIISLFIWGDGTLNPLIATLGVGGTERVLAYPIILYMVALGGYLTSRGEDWVRLRFRG
ncbi:MAG: DUF998 domain-containing protein [Methanobacteriaceae archaeon]|nr:DUF998 domain-containing protein [Methanobacteriaceae archaeon]